MPGSAAARLGVLARRRVCHQSASQKLRLAACWSRGSRLLNMQCPAGSGFLVEMVSGFSREGPSGSSTGSPAGARCWPCRLRTGREADPVRVLVHPLPLPRRSDTAVQALHFQAQRHQLPQLPLAHGIRRAGLGHARVRFSRRHHPRSRIPGRLTHQNRLGGSFVLWRLFLAAADQGDLRCMAGSINQGRQADGLGLHCQVCG